MPRFQLKKGYGKHLYKNVSVSGKENTRILREGDIVDCNEHELGGALDKFTRLDPEEKKLKDIAQAKLKAVKIKEGKKNAGKYWIINEASGKKLNKEPLSKKEAEEFVNHDRNDNPENMEE